MLNFITVPVTTAIVFFGVYKLFELFVRRKERNIIAQNLTELSSNPLQTVNLAFNSNCGKFTPIRFAAAAIGLGVGLILGFLLDSVSWSSSSLDSYDQSTVFYGGSTLICLGLALVACFIYEQKSTK